MFPQARDFILVLGEPGKVLKKANAQVVFFRRAI